MNRIARVIDEVDDHVLTTNPEHIAYLTGLDSSNAALLVGHTTRVLATDGRYAEVARECAELEGLDLVIDRDVVSACVQRAVNTNIRSVVSADVGSGEMLGVAITAMGDRPGGVTSDPIMSMRICKDDHELNAVSQAAAITAEVLADVPRWLRVGMSERRVAREVEAQFIERGAHDRAFATIVAFGSHTSRPHHTPSDRALERGDAVLIDAGAKVDSYCADMTRMYCLGAPPGWLLELHALVDAAARAARAEAVVGAPWRALDEAARAVLRAGGYEEGYLHGLGHGIGRSVHEPPIIRTTTVGNIAPRTTFTVEPGVYVSGIGGVRLEDTLVVDGHGVRVLTEASRDLVMIDDVEV